MKIFEHGRVPMNDEYFKEQAERVRALADKGDPFTRRRLLDLAESYDARLERPSRATRQLKSPSGPATPPTGDRAAFLCQEPQAVPQTDYFSLACGVHGGAQLHFAQVRSEREQNTSRRVGGQPS